MSTDAGSTATEPTTPDPAPTGSVARKNARLERLVQLQPWLGVLPLSLYACFHAWETSAAPSGRDAFVHRIFGSGSMVSLIGETLVVMIPLTLHGAIGLYIAARDRNGDGVYESRGLLRTQRLTGVIAFCFLVFHLAHTWFLKLGGSPVRELYDTLMDDLGRPLYVVIYAIGISSLCFHLGQGLPAFARRIKLVRSQGADKVIRVTAGVLALVLWIAWTNTLGYFARGSGLFWGSTESTESIERNTGSPQ